MARLVFKLGTINDLLSRGGIQLEKFPDKKEAKSELKKYMDYCKERDETIIEKRPEYFTVIRQNTLRTYAVVDF